MLCVTVYRKATRCSNSMKIKALFTVGEFDLLAVLGRNAMIFNLVLSK